MKPTKRTRWGLERGNIDLADRPVVKRPGGRIATVFSGSSLRGGKEVLIPHVGETTKGTFGTSKTRNAKVLSNKQANQIAAKTGKHLGKFRTPEQADRYARTLHVMQEKMYSPAAKGKKGK